MSVQKHRTAKKILTFILPAFLTAIMHSWTCAEDIIIDIGNGSGVAGSQNNSVRLSLDNTAEIVKGIQIYICDEGNYLTVTDCVATGRASNMSCVSNECKSNASSQECRRYPGCANIVLYSVGEVIKKGAGPVAIIKYDVFEDAPSGCFDLTPKGVIVSDQNKKPLSVFADQGEFCIRDSSNGDDTTTTAPSTTSATSETTPEEPSTDAPAGRSTPEQAAQSGSPISSSGLSVSEDRSPAAPLDMAETFPRQQGSVSGGNSPARSNARKSSGATTTAGIPPEALSRLVISPPVSAMRSGGTLALDARTIAEGVEVSGNYKWEITPPSTIGSIIDADGVFTAGNNTSSSPVEETIRATDTSNKNISAIASISIEGMQAVPEGCSLSLSPSSAEISSGSVINFTAQKLGNTCSEGSFQWRVNSKIGSVITEQGVYTAGINTNKTAALDIVMVKDSSGQLSTDAVLTVMPGEGVPPAAAASHNSPGTTGGSLHPGVLIAMAVLLSAPGILLLRKKFKR